LPGWRCWILFAREAFWRRARSGRSAGEDAALFSGGRRKHCVFLFMNGRAEPGWTRSNRKPDARKNSMGAHTKATRKVGSNGGRADRGHLMKFARSSSRKARAERTGDQRSLFRTRRKFADDLCVLRSNVFSDTAAPRRRAVLQMNSGSIFIGTNRRSWGMLNYGLGTLQFRTCPGLRGDGPIRAGGRAIGGEGASKLERGGKARRGRIRGTLFRSGGSPLLDLAHAGEARATARSATVLIC